MSNSWNDLREQQERERVARLMQQPNAVFVFGSNLHGVHGAGAAKEAAERYGAIRGVGEGAQGRAYAIPTKRHWKDPGLPLTDIAHYVNGFIRHARLHDNITFVVTRIGCGRAGYRDAEIALLFLDAPPNCELPLGWRALAHNARLFRQE